MKEKKAELGTQVDDDDDEPEDIVGMWQRFRKEGMRGIFLPKRDRERVFNLLRLIGYANKNGIGID